MNRREFAKSLAAAAATPALPFKAMAAPVAAPVAALRPDMVGWGALLARTHGQCSPQMLARLMHMEEGAAAQVVRQLVANGVVAPANAFGMSRAVHPLGPNLTPGARTFAPSKEALRPKLKALDGAEEAPTEEVEEDIEEAEE